MYSISTREEVSWLTYTLADMLCIYQPLVIQAPLVTVFFHLIL